ncbi:hypothetical protein [Elizabethkingia bruuniana]|uniref:hypothetical protein n=1 Tax=Elizabethkingia bruuniana TaxID=1756149 RepID=UPI0020139629|nr:hypothetical protein [Elizabethkingia bruuniana]MCL1636256.1 hypothetical protein [Elizabethkingia bruuniana]
MTFLEQLKYIKSILENPNQESLNMSLADTHHPNIFSLVIKGNNPGELTRVFISSKKLKPFEVQLHSHRYPIKLTVIKGNIKHFIAEEALSQDEKSIQLSQFEYKSPLNDGSGLKYINDFNFNIKEYPIPIGSIIKMSQNDIHTMSCSKGSIWIVEEQGFKTDSSIVLGVPFITEGLYNTPKQFQINDNYQLLKKEVNNLINNYEKVI